MSLIQLNDRQEKIIDIVKNNEPITSSDIAKRLRLTRSTIRPDLSILTMADILEAKPKVGYFYTGKTGFSYIAEAIKKMKVDEIQSRPVVIEETTSVYDAIVQIFLDDVSSLYVTDGEDLVGVISRKDLLKTALGEVDLNQIPAALIMTRQPLATIGPKDSVLEAANKLMDFEIDSLPVVEEIDGKAKIVGRFTKTSVTRLFVELGKGDWFE